MLTELSLRYIRNVGSAPHGSQGDFRWIDNGIVLGRLQAFNSAFNCENIQCRGIS
jgi:hypothetical protein